MTNQEMTEAILRLQPTAQFTLAGDDYENIQWFCNCSKPTLEEIQVEASKAPEIARQKEEQKQALLNRLGITKEEVLLLLS